MYATPKSTPSSKKLQRQKTTLSNCSDSDKDPVHVYCRLRPLQDSSVTQCVKLLSPQELSIYWDAKGVKKEVCYKFKHIFTAFSSQKEVFDSVAYPLVDDLLKGKNGLLFTYGVTGSGKTYTLQGDQINPGIMPRCIDTIFNSIEGFQTPKFVIKPDKMNGFEIQSEEEALQDRIVESKSSAMKTPKISRKPSQEKLTFTNEGSRVTILNETHLYAVFVTYIEIYNNNVYDLLDDSGNSLKLQSKLLREDANKTMYVNGVVEVEVKNAHEAYELLTAGQKRKRMAHTLLNTESSRSHSIFNIRVVQIDKEIGNVIPEKNFIQISQLSLVDLAGSERSNRTQNTGTRLKEASCINNSLMTLRMCLEMLRENQRNKAGKMVPYRDSRLTYIFKNYFEGDGTVHMMVCVNPTLDDLDENLHVMKFAEISQEVKVTRPEPKYTPVSVKKTITKKKEINRLAPLTLFSDTNDIPLFKFCENITESISTLNNLSVYLKQAMGRTVINHTEIEKRHQIFRKKLVKSEQELCALRNESKTLKYLHQKDLKKISGLELKVDNSQTVNNNQLTKINELETELKATQHKLKEKDLRINQDRIEKVCIKQKNIMEEQRMNQEFEEKVKRQRDHMNFVMKAKLQRAKEVLESDLNIDIPKPKTTDENVEPRSVPSVLPRRMQGNTPRPKRRSRSTGDRWLEHVTIKPVALDTVMQPTMKKRKSITKLVKASDVTDPKQSKYCLLAQEAQEDGELETKLYKGDIVPTVSGGAQVILHDVEKLRQESPTK